MASAKEYLERYSSITCRMSTWIAEQLWDGHEKCCAKYAGGPGPCDCIQAVRAEWHKLDHDIEMDEMRHMPDLVPRMMDLQAENDVLKHDLKCALDALCYVRGELRGIGPSVERHCSEVDETQELT